MNTGDRLRQLRQNNNMTLEELGDKLGVSHATIYKYEKGEIANMKQSTIEKLANIFGVSPIYIMGLDLTNPSVKIPDSVKKIPILGTICAGDGIFCEENYEGYFIADPEIKRADFVVKVEGDSMSGDKIQDGDMAFLRSTHAVDNGKIAAVLLKTTNEVMLKRVYVKEDHAILQPSNPTYSPITTDNFLILGELVGIYHKVE
ncbi:LexA family protein [Ezakiella peruensis]|uniref:LexA family protein n=1 Tax=Ezakiella peruensis TaxID=1464038 RepID=UPI000C1B0472|nr:S24 family peptidase [Ezakiella peruensis]